ncbi:MAG TPA: hypothetical protein VMJ32_10370 [Pirellulales bacterium]|nr:hypothetical protein [Pirellulales bacterium]
MSISDLAFIRAYHKDPSQSDRGSIAAIDIGLGSVIPPPHAKFPPMDAPAAAQSHEQPSASASGSAEEIGKATPSGAISDLGAPHAGVSKPHISLGRSPKAALSSYAGFTAAATTASDKTKPALEIDAVRWPAVCETLQAKATDGFDRLAADLCTEAEAGRKVTAITGAARCEGRTTLALCLARQLAAANAKVALVDADFSSPQMAALLGIAVERGWETALAGDETLWETMIDSVTDKFALALLGRGVSASAPAASTGQHAVLIPVTGSETKGVHVASVHVAGSGDAVPVRFVPQAFRIAAALSELAEHFDVVLIDAGPLGQDSATTQWLLEPTVGVHNIILAHDVRRNEAHKLAAACLQLAEAKQHQLGIAETFVGEEAGGKLQAAGSRQ